MVSVEERNVSREDLVLRRVKELLKTHDKCVGLRITNITGMPDMVACVNGHFLGIEVKDDINGSYGMTKAQKVRLIQIANAGGLACCVDKNNYAEFVKLIDNLSKSDILPDCRFWGWEGVM